MASRVDCFTIRPPLSQIATIVPRCLLTSTFQDFGLAPKQNLWLLWTLFGIVLVNKLVSMAWLLRVLRSFRRFTSHCIRWWLQNCCGKHRKVLSSSFESHPRSELTNPGQIHRKPFKHPVGDFCQTMSTYPFQTTIPTTLPLLSNQRNHTKSTRPVILQKRLACIR